MEGNSTRHARPLFNDYSVTRTQLKCGRMHSRGTSGRRCSCPHPAQLGAMELDTPFVAADNAALAWHDAQWVDARDSDHQGSVGPRPCGLLASLLSCSDAPRLLLRLGSTAAASRAIRAAWAPLTARSMLELGYFAFFRGFLRLLERI